MMNGILKGISTTFSNDLNDDLVEIFFKKNSPVNQRIPPKKGYGNATEIEIDKHQPTT